MRKKESIQWRNTHRHDSLAIGTCVRYIPGNSASSHSSKRCLHRKENAYLHRRQQTISFPLVFFPRTNHTERILVRLSYHFFGLFLFNIIFSSILFFLFDPTPYDGLIVLVATSIVNSYIFCAAYTRRFHDIGRSGKWLIPFYLISWIPYFPLFVFSLACGCFLLFITTIASDRDNKYGPQWEETKNKMIL